MPTFILEDYGLACQIEEGPDFSTLSIDGKKVLTSSAPDSLIAFMSLGKTGHKGWDKAGGRAVPPIKYWRQI